MVCDTMEIYLVNFFFSYFEESPLKRNHNMGF